MERLNELRKAKGITWDRLAVDLDMPRSTLLEWGAGRGVSALDRLPVIADYFGVTVDYLLGLSDTIKIEVENTNANVITFPTYKQKRLKGLKSIRNANGLTQEEVATYLGMAQNNYSNIENGKINLLTCHATKLCELYGCTMDMLFGVNLVCNPTKETTDKKMPKVGDKVWVIYENELTEETVEFVGDGKFILAGFRKTKELFWLQLASNKGCTWFDDFEEAKTWLLSKYDDEYTLVEETKTWYWVGKL